MAKNPFYDRTKAHHTPSGFQNPDPIVFKQRDMLKWQRERLLNHYPPAPQAGYEAFNRTWWQPADLTVNHDAVWWLGHSTLLFKLGDKTVLTDPLFSLRASPVSFFGPKRKTPPPVAVEQLPHIDVVVLSHNHYDHLDLPSIRALMARSPDTQFLVPLGVKGLIAPYGQPQNIQEMDWWQQCELSGMRFTFVPARHWSARGILDRHRTLWGGWMINHQARNYYFMGDTGYTTLLHEIPQRLGKIDFAAIPIGAYAPRWFMQSQHIDPPQAVQLHQELECTRSLGIHWGVFELADEPLDAPPDDLRRSLQAKNLDPDCFKTIKIGDFLAL